MEIAAGREGRREATAAKVGLGALPVGMVAAAAVAVAWVAPVEEKGVVLALMGEGTAVEMAGVEGAWAVQEAAAAPVAVEVVPVAAVARAVAEAAWAALAAAMAWGR